MANIAPIPHNEAQRLEWLRQCEILDTLPEMAFDAAAELAAQVCRVPTAAINLIDWNRQWSKAAVGQDKKQDARDISFCAHTILQPDLMVVTDTQGDPRFADNPLVLGDPFIRFYAGAPLVTSEGYGIGSLCVVDRVPRQLTLEQVAVLRLLAHQIVDRIELKRHVILQNILMAERERLLGLVQQAAQLQYAFLRDVLSSVTGGKLRLCPDQGALPSVLEQQSDWVPLSEPHDMSKLRVQTQEFATAAGFTNARCQDLVTAVSEAAMNAVVHGGGGQGRICRGPSTLQVWVQDQGSGIDMENLPRATLERGYTTAGTLGQGMKMMLDTADRIYLLTGAGGTLIVIEQDREVPLPAWLSIAV